MAHTVALANQKGGVGKTTTALNLGAGLASQQKRVLVVDADPQGNASTGLGFQRQSRNRSLYGVLVEEKAADSAILSFEGQPGLDLLPATVDLAAAELELVDKAQREQRLSQALQPLQDRYDYILIDCPPALGLLTLNALVAAQKVLVPLQTEFYALEGLSHLLRTVERVRKTANPQLEVEGIVLTMADPRTRLTQQVEQDVRAHLGGRVYQTLIPRNVRISEAPSHGLPILDYDPQSLGALAYRALSQEFLHRNGVPHGQQ